MLYFLHSLAGIALISTRFWDVAHAAANPNKIMISDKPLHELGSFSMANAASPIASSLLTHGQVLGTTCETCTVYTASTTSTTLTQYYADPGETMIIKHDISPQLKSLFCTICKPAVTSTIVNNQTATVTDLILSLSIKENFCTLTMTQGALFDPRLSGRRCSRRIPESDSGDSTYPEVYTPANRWPTDPSIPTPQPYDPPSVSKRSTGGVRPAINYQTVSRHIIRPETMLNGNAQAPYMPQISVASSSNFNSQAYFNRAANDGSYVPKINVKIATSANYSVQTPVIAGKAYNFSTGYSYGFSQGTGAYTSNSFGYSQSLSTSSSISTSTSISSSTSTGFSMSFGTSSSSSCTSSNTSDCVLSAGTSSSTVRELTMAAAEFSALGSTYQQSLTATQAAAGSTAFAMSTSTGWSAGGAAAAGVAVTQASVETSASKSAGAGMSVVAMTSYNTIVHEPSIFSSIMYQTVYY